ncbi:protein hu-li tai shao isoform X1 [Bactrocera neohumeralis]|uniref:protein hu-li tai shao isoform X1 n=1 Tax=Bactrocera neohumeralis TaxID=98809 RepID=UPI00216654EF|nr:protein hu-li tai shao isoform X1 [Bactrocera neohumeralis]XP_050325087.1 protein hu-li tai shao isoform X1 [Bactrocera neohumeralis]XP_050325088.1 protein hu-li tai shao isoform X1 [Bactrocera neohumeralis]XP_050325089.1 protein hu-li tai shao isoform X1 [Bactrocera neohumeralis]XP_050325090.1 protein hu-li tai shao isoform X1 [Bactrocera neohumeralis]XP_050325091.1 protein hu-li tai shao isoform X1 [Bactrocera neohumeralis]
MTEVEQQPPPQNGIDLSAAEEDDSSKARPADIEQDMREMERRKRVEAIMGSKLFREELERIVDSARDGGGILQQLSDIMGVPTSTRVGNVFKATNCMLPINDIRGVESMGYAKGEKILRCKLAATFRLLDLYGWTQGLGAQITARLKVDQENFLVNPYGMMYHEITASSLNKVDMQGQVVEQGTTNFGVNKNHFALHSVVHAARPDIRCAIYIGCTPVVAVSSLKVGLLPLTRDACVLGEVTTHSYTGTQMDADERDRLVRALGPNSKVLILSNYGALCCGETIEEAFFAASHIVKACETQLQLLPVGVDNLVLIPEESRKAIYAEARRPPEDLEKKFAAAVATVEANAAEAAAATTEAGGVAVAAKSTTGAPKWRVGGAEFEALMRMLDNAGYRTGYIYRHPLIKSDPPKPKNDVELPPAVSSLGYLLEEEELLKQGIWKKGDLRKGGDRSRWLNSPNVYQKVEVLETGTPDPKKITKWVAEGSPTHSTPVRIEDPLQFVPAGTNPKEFRRLQQQIKDNRRADKISAGPQSHILEGVTWDEANRIKDATVSSAGDHVVLMGAASKGIIQRGYQHNAAVYKAPYAKNPFDNVTDDELNEYKRTVERKKKSIHGEYTDTDFSESEPLSSMPISAPPQTKQITIATAAVSQSEPEDVSEHQVMRIETQQAPIPSQAEVVLSDATFHQQQTPLSLTTNTKIHIKHTQQSYEIPSLQKFALLKSETLHNFTSVAAIAKKYAFLYKPRSVDMSEVYPSQHCLVFNVWMIHKIEIFPHYTYPLPDGAAKLKGNTNNLERSPEQIVLKPEHEDPENDKCVADAATHTPSLSSSPPADTNLMQPYRTCSHYGFNYPITYQPHITIHPAHLLTAVQLQREKVIAFIKSTALSLNTGYLQQQRRELYSTRQPRAPRLKSCEALRFTSNASKDAATQHTTTHSDSQNNNDSNGSYISVKEIKLEPTKRRRRISKVSSDRSCDTVSVAGRVQQLSEHDRDMHTPRLTHAHSLSEQFSSLLSIGGTSYPAGSHSHTADLEEGVEEEHHHVDDGVHPQHYDDDSGDNYSAVFARPATPTTQRASYLLREFLPANAQPHEMPEHKPESEQELHHTDVKLLTSTPKVRKLLNSCDDDEPDERHLYPHHSHKQIKLTVNSKAQSAALKRHSTHATAETPTAVAAISVGLPHERYRHVTASLSEAGSSSAASSLRSLEIHININVKNSDCARTLQTHETEFRRKLERIINEEINVIAQQLSAGAQQHSTDCNNMCDGLHMEHNDNSLLDLSNASAHHLLQHSAHLETLSDLRLAGTLAAGQQRMHSKAAHRKSHSQTHAQRRDRAASCNSTDSTCCVSGAATKADQPLTPQQLEVVAMLEQELESLLNGIICANALHNHAVMCDCKMKVARISKELRTSLNAGK